MMMLLISLQKEEIFKLLMQFLEIQQVFLVGDFLYSRSFQMMVKIDNMSVMQVLADATNKISEGEVLQLINSHNPQINETQYFEVIDFKTAKLI